MVYVRRYETKGKAVFYLARLDRSVVNHRYFTCIGQARNYAKELGLKVIN